MQVTTEVAFKQAIKMLETGGRKVQKLTFEGLDLSKKGGGDRIIRLTSALQGNNLTQLHFHNCGIDNDGAKKLANMLRSNSSITSFGLWDDGIF